MISLDAELLRVNLSSMVEDKEQAAIPDRGVCVSGRVHRARHRHRWTPAAA